MSFSSTSDECSGATFKVNYFPNKAKCAPLSDNNGNFDWDKINCNLKINGFPELSLRFNENDDLYFDRNGTMALRYLISDLLKKQTKNYENVKELLSENDKLKSILKDDSFVMKRYEETIKNLNDSLLDSKQRLKEISNSKRNSVYGNQENKVELEPLTPNELSEQSRQIVITRYYNLQQICDEQRQEINTLQMKMNKLTTIEESRRNRQRDIFHQLRNKAPNSYNALDKRLLDIIDSYESKVLQLESHMTFFSNLGFSLPDDDLGNELFQSNNNNTNNNNTNSNISLSSRVDVSDEYKRVISKMQEEIRSMNQEKLSLEDKCELLKLESNSKPSLQELKDVITKLKEYKQLLNFHNIRPEKDRLVRTSRQNVNGKLGQYPNRLEDIEFLPLKTCQRYLMDFCTHLNSNSITEAFNMLSELLQINSVFPTYFSLFSRLSQLIHTPGLPKFVNVSEYDLSQPKTIENTYIDMVNILELWVHQLCSTSQLFSLVEQLRSTLLPWSKPIPSDIRPGIHGSIDILNDLLDQCEVENESSALINPTFGQYKGLVEHFQNIFDCPNIIGVYSKMNMLYTKYTEMQNVLDTLKRIINIEDQRGLACLVAEVDGLVEISQYKFNKDLDNLGLTKDIETLVTKLERYEKFIPDFEDLVNQITDLLGVTSIDEIVPRVASLQLSARITRQ